MAAPVPCPLCNIPLESEAKVLYGHRVCGKCHQDFALRRVLAEFLDLMLLQLVAIPLSIGILLAAAIIGAAASAAAGGNDDFGARVAVLIWVLAVLLMTFFVVAKDGFNGHSPVKYMLGLQVIDSTTGRPANFWDAFKRNLPASIPFMPIYCFFQLMTQDGYRLGDGWARTKVIWKKYREVDLFLPLNELRRRNRERAAAAAAVGLPPAKT